MTSSSSDPNNDFSLVKMNNHELETVMIVQRTIEIPGVFY